MSSGLNCHFLENEPGKWYYLLEQWNAPKTAWDWRENADCYGPFPTFEKAHEHLGRHHSNPGGYFKSPHDPNAKPSKVIEECIKNAINPLTMER